MRETFGRRLTDAVATRGPLCAGVDAHPELLRAWGLPVTVNGLERFALTATEAMAETVAVLKPQSAFFESYGAAGIAVLERVLAFAREAGALVLLDVKRGDIGSTMEAYAAAYLADAAPLGADAITISPYLGFGSVEPALRAATESGRGVFLLSRTSNPEGEAIQRAQLPGSDATVAQSLVDAVARHNAGAEPVGDVGVVAGATQDPGELRFTGMNGPILAPGLGEQGATADDLERVFGAQRSSVLPAASRSLLRHGPDRTALETAVRRMQESLARLLY